MLLLEDSEILRTRNELIEEVFNTELDDLSDIIKSLSTNDSIKDLACVDINWNDDELKGKSEEDIKFIKTYRNFIQQTFNEYQIRSLKILADANNKLTSDDLTPAEKRTEIEGLIQQDIFNLLVTLFIKSSNWGMEQSSKLWNDRIEEIERLYIGKHAELSEACEKIAELEKENERLRNKKFLGIFKVN